MPFEKGHGKYGGRKKGSQNKDTKQLRELLKSLISENQIKEDLAELTSSERLSFIAKILPYCLSKEVTKIDVNNDNDNTKEDLSKWSSEDLITMYNLYKKYDYTQ